MSKTPVYRVFQKTIIKYILPTKQTQRAAGLMGEDKSVFKTSRVQGVRKNNSLK